MADREMLERRLTELGPRLAFPGSVDLRAGVRQAIAARTKPSRSSKIFQSPLLRAAVAFAVLVALTLVVSPPARRAVADLIGLRGVDIRISPPPSGTPRHASIEQLDLGRLTSVEEASALAGFDVLLIEDDGLGAADSVHFSPGSGAKVSFLYRPRAGVPQTTNPAVGLLFTQFRATVEGGFIQKSAGSGTRVEPVTVNGGRGYWIEGTPHFFAYRDASGRIREETLRLAGNTLLWEQNGLTLRIESALPKSDVMRIAASVR